MYSIFKIASSYDSKYPEPDGVSVSILAAWL